MTDPAELQAKIAALQGQINKRKQQPHAHRGAPQYAQHVHTGNARWSPFGGVGKPPPRQPHRNRVLVLGGGQPTGGSPDREPTAPNTPPTPAKQSLDRDAFKAPDSRVVTAQGHQQPRPIPIPRSSRVNSAPQQPTKAAAEPARELVVDGLRFEVHAGGSKLIRVTDPATAAKETPKRAKIADVQFLRTKHGNLIRAVAGKNNKRRTQVPQCENFTKHGTCSFGPACRFTHDPNKVAICKDFLHKGTCKAGRNCDMSHEPTYHRAPACTHFLRGNCTNSACRYPHVNISPAASVCRPFATLGFCSKGADCEKRHVFECPDYANHGHCANREKNACSLPHIDRAGALRKAAERQAKNGSEDESDLSSDDDDGHEVDSDVAEDIDMDDDSHELSQQQDFVGFS